MQPPVAEFVSQRWSMPREAFSVRVEPLRGGLESAVVRATMTRRPADAPVPGRFVVKRLTGDARREAEIYDLLWQQRPAPPAPRVLGVQDFGEMAYLYLEDVTSRQAWPWADRGAAGLVCRVIARLHDTPAVAPAVLEWDYEAHLRQSADATLAALAWSRGKVGERHWRRAGDLRRVVGALPRLRAHLLAPGRTIIHGDLHPGNVMMRQKGGAEVVALIDWGRARLGSPLEDLASWLHSLGCWEPEARRAHDTLWREYLQARRAPSGLTPDLRTLYWFASASNGLAGAIRYHLAVLSDPAARPAARRDSHRALRAWERVIRRAAALLTATRAC